MTRPDRPARKTKSSTSSGSREEGTVRIIGGHLRGRLLPFPVDPRTRPMKDRVREAVFNLVGPTVVGSYAIDLFAGTGVLGIEAVSRGAASATLIERHFPTARAIEDRAAAFGIADQIHVISGDAFTWVRRPTVPADRPWVVFCSPPFEFFVKREAEMLKLLTTLMESAPPGSVLAVEADEHFDVQLLPRPEEWDVREYPPATVAMLRLPAAGQPVEPNDITE